MTYRAPRIAKTAKKLLTAFALCGLVFLSATSTLSAPKSFWAFETGPVRPMAIAEDGSKLFVVNIPDHRLEIFALSATTGPALLHSVEVGLEPSAVAVRNASEVWVVNHLSDSVSIVDIASSPPRVTRTLLVGDEPRDIVFAGAAGERAFITTAHRGQHHPADPQFRDGGVGRADVWVFDADALGDPLTGTPETILQLFSDTPRALAASPDGGLVYAAAFHSGNQTTTIRESFFVPVPEPSANTVAPIAPAPPQGRILGFDGTDWRDATGAIDNSVRFKLPDHDVFTIDADAATPIVIAEHTNVGTILFDMAVHPTNGKVYVANTDANNRDRFEGFSTTFGNLRGELHKARVTVLDGPTVAPRHLNKHLAALTSYSAEGNPGARDDSLAIPVDLAFSEDGATLFVAAYGSSKIGVFDTAALDADTFVPNADNHIEVSGGGPAGLIVDTARGLLYAYTRFDHAIAIIDLERRVELFSVPLHDREPPNFKSARPLLYDARFASSNGEGSCAVCHVFGDLDSLAWNLGEPEQPVVPNLNPLVSAQIVAPNPTFHPLKGPMTTQTFRGMDHHGPMHWRGDRTAIPGGGVFDDEFAHFLTFNAAFVGLLGRETEIPAADMADFANFILELVPPPNPVRALDNQLTPSEQLGHDIFIGPVFSDGTGACVACHGLDPSQGLFGSQGRMARTDQPQVTKAPQLRNAYQKVGMFGMDGQFSVLGNQLTGDPNDDQIRGFGFLHDGSFDSLDSFVSIFDFGPSVTAFGLSDASEAITASVEFVLAFPSNLAPIVGQQVTAFAPDVPTVPPFPASVTDRIVLFEQRASTDFALESDAGAKECNLIVKGVVSVEARGFLYEPLVDLYVSDRIGGGGNARADLLALAEVPGQALTWTCMPPGSGIRAGLDRDEDNVLDGDDNCATAPNGPGGGTCVAGDTSSLGNACAASLECGAAGFCSVAQEDTGSDGIGDACDPVFVPEASFLAGLLGGLALLAAAASRTSRAKARRGHSANWTRGAAALSIAAAMLAVAPSAAEAVTRTYVVTGVVDSLVDFPPPGSPALPFALGDSYSSTFTLDDGLPDALPANPALGLYDLAVTSFTFQLGGFSANASDNGNLHHVFNDFPTVDTWSAIAEQTSPTLPGRGSASWFLIDVLDDSGQLVTDDSFQPLAAGDLRGASSVRFRFRWNADANNTSFLEVSGKITSLESVFTAESVLTSSEGNVGPLGGQNENLIDGSGLANAGADLRSRTHDAAADASTMWQAGELDGGLGGPVATPPPAAAPPLVEDQALVFDLGESVDLAGLYVWNFGPPAETARGVGQFGVFVSEDTDPLTATYLPVGTFTLAEALGDGFEPAQRLDFPDTPARLVRFELDEAISGLTADYVGLSEVRFVPEPRARDGLLAALLLGLMAIVAKRLGSRQLQSRLRSWSWSRIRP